MLTIRTLHFREQAIFQHVGLQLKATAFSVSLEINCRLLIRRKFLFSSSSPGFLSNGCTKAFFHSSANRPVFSDKLIIFVMTGSRWSRCIDIIEDGSGSRSHDFLQASANFFTCSSVSDANSEKEGSVEPKEISVRIQKPLDKMIRNSTNKIC